MNAKEAREISDKVIQGKISTQLSDIRAEIGIRAPQGDTFITWYEPILSEVVKKLEEEGFFVGVPTTSREDTLTKISW